MLCVPPATYHIRPLCCETPPSPPSSTYTLLLHYTFAKCTSIPQFQHRSSSTFLCDAHLLVISFASSTSSRMCTVPQEPKFSIQSYNIINKSKKNLYSNSPLIPCFHIQSSLLAPGVRSHQPLGPFSWDFSQALKYLCQLKT